MKLCGRIYSHTFGNKYVGNTASTHQKENDDNNDAHDGEDNHHSELESFIQNWLYDQSVDDEDMDGHHGLEEFQRFGAVKMRRKQ